MCVNNHLMFTHTTIGENKESPETIESVQTLDLFVLLFNLIL